MFEPIRGGTRGGQAEFKWSDVSADKDRENYLGHSINAPTGRWQKNKDVHWYNRDVEQGDAARAEEIKKIKEAEAEALAAALGFTPASKTAIDTPASGANATISSAKVDSMEASSRASEKEERRRRKAERKEEKRARKDARRGQRATNGHNSDEYQRQRNRSRSRSPKRQILPTTGSPYNHRRPRSRSGTPPERGRHTASRIDSRYDADERDRERERDRRRWATNYRRDQPASGGR